MAEQWFEGIQTQFADQVRASAAERCSLDICSGCVAVEFSDGQEGIDDIGLVYQTGRPLFIYAANCPVRALPETTLLLHREAISRLQERGYDIEETTEDSEQ